MTKPAAELDELATLEHLRATPALLEAVAACSAAERGSQKRLRADFAADLLENVAGIAPVGGNLSPMVEVTLFEQESSGAQLVHLVNGSGHFGTTFYAPVPMYELVAEVPCASQPASAVSLVTKKDVPVQFGDGTLSVNVASLGLFEAVKLTW